MTLSCGAAAEAGDPEQIGTSYAELCAGARERHGDFVTASGCAFEQHVRNIMVYGDSITPQLLVDGSGQFVATVVQSCDSWWLGADADAVVVLLDSETGRIISHGTEHPGLDTSQLPDRLPTPFTLR